MRKSFTFLFASLLFSLISFSQSKGLQFDGINDYVTIPERAGVLTGSTFTFETWVKPTAAFTSNGPVFHKANAAYNQALDVYFYADGSNGSLAIDFYTANGTFYIYDYVLPVSWINQWHHLALAYNGSTLQLFVDGNPAGSTPASGSLSATGAVANLGYLGGGNPGYFPGVMDELRIWNVARTQAQIQASMNNEIPAGTTGLTAYYRFNQGTINGTNTAITTIVDEVAGNSGTLVNFARTGTTSNFVTGYGSLVLLALKDASFIATKTAAGVQLDWRSTTAEGPSLFTVERSANGSEFTAIGTVNAPATTAEAAQSFTDHTPPSPMAYYRVKSTDADGRITYSKTLVVRIDNSIGGMQVYPNPASSAIQLQLTAPKGVVLIEVKDLGGRTVQTMQMVSQGNAVYTTMDISKLAKGVYTITAGNSSTLLMKQ